MPDSSHRRAVLGFGGASCLLEVDAGGRHGKAGLDSGLAGLDGGRSLVGQAFFDRREHLLDGKAEQPAGDAERDHVGAPVGNGLGHVLHRDFDDARAGLGHHRRQVAAARIADHQGVRSGLDFGAETVGVQPVDADQEVEPVGQSISTGSTASRSRAAASPPRICGPMVRVNSPCQPAAQAVSSRESPVVSAPAPPLPMIAIEMLGEAAHGHIPLI